MDRLPPIRMDAARRAEVRLHRATRRRDRRRATGLAVSVAVHALIFGGVILGLRAPDPPPEVEAIEATLVTLPPPAPPAPKPAPKPKPSRAARRVKVRTIARPMRLRPTPVLARVQTLPAHARPIPDPGEELSDAELAGAASADGGSGDGGHGDGGGGACDMARRLQGALRRDPLVRAAVIASGGHAIRVWNGDWVRNGGEDGKGLAAVREAILWEVGFSPAACRAEAVHGLILLSVDGSNGPVRLAVGAGNWRWSDLLRSGRAGVVER